MMLFDSWQMQVRMWCMACFGSLITDDKVERNHRFLEESLELVQSLGCSKEEAHQLVDYVFNRDQGDVNQELGGVMTTLAALANAHNISMSLCADKELTRCWFAIDKIRAKQKTKPKHSPLPQVTGGDLNG